MPVTHGHASLVERRLLRDAHPDEHRCKPKSNHTSSHGCTPNLTATRRWSASCATSLPGCVTAWWGARFEGARGCVLQTSCELSALRSSHLRTARTITIE